MNPSVDNVLDDPLGSVGLLAPKMDLHNPDVYVSPNSNNISHHQSSPSSANGDNSLNCHTQLNNGLNPSHFGGMRGTRPRTGGMNGISPTFGGTMSKSRSRPSTSPAYHQTTAVGRAGPTIGGNGQMLQNQYKGHPSNRPPFNNFLIFIVDVEGAIRLEAAKTLPELSEDIMDVLGLKLPKGKEMQAIYAGYDGPLRIGINTDEEMRAYYNNFQDASNKVKKTPSHYDARTDPEMQHIIKELEKMRLGGILTKMQMSKYLRLLGETKADWRQMSEELGELRQKYEELSDSVPNQIKEAEDRVLYETTKRLTAEHKVAMQQMLDKSRAEANAIILPLKETIKKYREKEYAQKEEVKAALAERDAMELREQTAQKEAKRQVELAKEKVEEAAALTKAIAAVEKQKRQVETQLQEAYNVLDENGIRRPDSDSSGGESGSAGKSTRNTYSWNVPKILERFSWPKERSLCSADVKVGDVSSVTLEFYPGGVEASWPGYCALRIHVPDRTALTWGMYAGVGENRYNCGSRSDEFSTDFWWCRKGILWPNLCKVETLRRQMNREANNLCLTFEILKSSVMEKQQLSRTNSLPRPVTAGAATGFGRRNLEDYTLLKANQKKAAFDKKFVKILYKNENLTNAWLADFVINWLTTRSMKSTSTPMKSPFS